MIKAWLLIFILSTDPRVEDNYLGKVEVPLTSMTECIQAKRRLTQEGQDVRYRMICVTDDHHAGRKVDPGVPLEF